MNETNAQWKFGDTGRRATSDRDRVMSDDEAVAYHDYIKPIMHERALQAIERHNEAYRAIDPETLLRREKGNAAFRKKYEKKKLRVSKNSDLCIDE